jgi:RNA recognition motif-containing protein
MKIFVGSIRDYITEEILREHFSPYGTVEAIMHKGSYAFVFMPDDSEANSACQALHRTELMGCTMNVENAKPSAVGAKPVFNSSVAAGALGSAAGGTAQHIKMESQGLVVSGVTNGASENATGGNPRKHPKFHHIQGRIKLIIGNIGDTDKTKLETYFQTFGTVYETFIMEGKGVGFCHVDEMKAEHMIEAAHGTELNGHEILFSC